MRRNIPGQPQPLLLGFLIDRLERFLYDGAQIEHAVFGSGKRLIRRQGPDFARDGAGSRHHVVGMDHDIRLFLADAGPAQGLIQQA